MIKLNKLLTTATMLAAAALTVQAAVAQDKPTLGVLIYNVGGDPWINVATSTFETKGAEMGFDVTVADGRNDVAQMNAAMEQFIVQGVDAIIVQPADPDSIVGSVQRAIEAGIPVVSFSHSLSPDANATSYVGADEVSMGRTQAELAVKVLDGVGNVALMTGILGTSPQIGRTQGQHEIFDATPGIKVVEEQANDWQGDKTVSLIQGWLSKYPKGELNAVLAHGPELVAAAEYAHSQGRDEVKFIALDYPADARAAIQNGILYATINQSPATMAEVALQTVKTALEGGAVEPVILIDTPVVTAENVEASPAAY
ncbi:MAG: ribose transporter, ribose-binding protein [Devosia sp.]|jgi:ABC-type sugar transport system substrate-binding protein|uniref:sugar ABC transporter substrate-binding protein n=1 Tax=Devosia sp. TaxID=1871048 RepID=UPI00260C4121|nr:sugar ABC transporter substrate-binding protein [Devosia sp.]MDB5527125.1 ribose transporter, ribose-binding protein [Devosia sp.]